MEKIFTELSALAFLFVPRLIAALVIAFIAWLLGKALQKGLLRLGRKVEEEKRQVLLLAAASGKATALIVGLITALGTIGINVTALVAGLGLSGFALGFALKDVLSNFLAGALILMYRPFETGDKIAVSGNEGEVVEINLRYTVLRAEADKYLVPNSTLLTNLISVKGAARAVA